MEELFLPVLSHFINGNFWTASVGRTRFRLDPTEEQIHAALWQGPWSQEFSAVEAEEDFPMSEEGLDAIRKWVASHAAGIESRPAETLAEQLARRDRIQAEKQ